MEILFEDRYLLIVNKAPGIPVAPDPTGDPTLFQEAAAHLDAEKPGSGGRIGIPHRLDRPTSGIVIFTKDPRTLASVSAAFAGNRIRKTYWAAVDGPPSEVSGTLIHEVFFDPAKNKASARDPEPGTGEQEKRNAEAPRSGKSRGKKAVLRYRLIGKSDRFFLLEIRPETGRHHQIRAQLAKIGLHIKGDVKYGYPRTNRVPGIHLHARSISFTHPVSRKKMDLTAPLPDDPVWKVLQEQAERGGSA